MNSDINDTNRGCACLALFWITVGLLMTMWTDRNIDFWLSHIKGESVDVHWFWSLLLSVFGGGFTVLFNIVSEIAHYVI